MCQRTQRVRSGDAAAGSGCAACSCGGEARRRGRSARGGAVRGALACPVEGCRVRLRENTPGRRVAGRARLAISAAALYLVTTSGCGARRVSAGRSGGAARRSNQPCSPARAARDAARDTHVAQRLVRHLLLGNIELGAAVAHRAVKRRLRTGRKKGMATADRPAARAGRRTTLQGRSLCHVAPARRAAAGGRGCAQLRRRVAPLTTALRLRFLLTLFRCRCLARRVRRPGRSHGAGLGRGWRRAARLARRR